MADSIDCVWVITKGLWGIDYWAKYPVLSATDKTIKVNRSHTHVCDDFIRLNRQELEKEGKVWHNPTRRHYYRFPSHPDVVDEMPQEGPELERIYADCLFGDKVSRMLNGNPFDLESYVAANKTLKDVRDVLEGDQKYQRLLISKGRTVREIITDEMVDKCYAQAVEAVGELENQKETLRRAIEAIPTKTENPGLLHLVDALYVSSKMCLLLSGVEAWIDTADSEDIREGSRTNR